MAYPVAAGHADLSSTGTSGFIPAVWSTKTAVKYYKKLTAHEICNRDWEGEIKRKGDTVEIRTVGDVTVRPLRKGEKIVYETIESPKIQLKIDQGNYWGAAMDSIDLAQMDIPYVNKVTEDAANKMKIEVDRDLLAFMPTEASTTNKGNTAGAVSGGYLLGATGAPIALTRINILDLIIDCGSVLAENDVPEENRWIVLPIWAANYLKKSDIKDASLTGVESTLPNGRIGTVDGMRVFRSNNLTAVTDGSWSCSNIVFGTNDGCTLADQFVGTETLKNPDAIGDLVRGWNVYGRKVTQPKALGVLYARKA